MKFYLLVVSPWSLNWFFHTWFIRAKVFKNFHIILNDSLSLIICYFFLSCYSVLSFAPRGSPMLLFVSLAYYPYFLFPYLICISWYIEWNLIRFLCLSLNQRLAKYDKNLYQGQILFISNRSDLWEKRIYWKVMTFAASSKLKGAGGSVSSVKGAKNLKWME